jgi:hypothetical protein
MDMKNTKAIFLIVLGSFIIATGFAFAENVSYEQLKSGPFGGVAMGDLTVAADPSRAATAPAPVTAAPAPAAAAAVPAVSAPAPAPAPGPTAKEKAKEFLQKHMGTMVLTGIGAYLGFALFGPIGLLLGGLFMFGVDYLGNL